MLDLYLIITPVFALLSLITLLNFKLALAEPKHSDLPKYQSKIIEKQHKAEDTNSQKERNDSLYFKTLKYLLKNFTLADFCLARRATNKIPFLLSIPAFALHSLFIKNEVIYFFTFIGCLTTFFYISAKMFIASKEKQKESSENQPKKQTKANNQQKNSQKLEIIFTSLTLLANLAIIWLLYKNNNNSQILTSVFNFLIIFALDNFLIRPLFLSLVSIPLKFWAFTDVFIQKQTQILQILHGERILKQSLNKKRMASIMNRAHNTTSNTQNTFEIEPCVNYDLNGINLPKQNIDKSISKCSFTYKKSERKVEQSQSSLIKYINYPFKGIEPNTVGSKLCNLKKLQLDDKTINESSINKKQNIQASSIKRKRNKLYSEKIGSIPEFKYDEHRHSKNAQNQEQINHIQNQGLNQGSYLSAKKSTTSRNNQSAKKPSETKIHRHSLERKTLYNSNEKPQPIQKQQNFHNSCVSGFNYTLKTDLLKIREDKNGQNLEQIDMNSPERRHKKIIVKTGQQRKMSANQNEQNLKMGVKKIFKKFSLDPNHQVLQRAIESRTHEISQIQKQDNAEAEYGSNRKKPLYRTSQIDLSRKSDVFARFSNDSRMAKSVKRTKKNKDPIVRQNDENRIPQFVIQDFNC